MAEPIRAVNSISKMTFNVNYFRMLRKKQIEQFFGVINLSDSDSEEERINLMMEKLTIEEAGDLQKQNEDSMKQRKGKRVAGPSGVVDSGGEGKTISPRTRRLTPDKMDQAEG
ncbi:hypothetical protein Fot_32311 [Forsythia ovata]|uniref:Uncharacterized protein n=1 Tax=Forsythia ovata TaxID=205694 RepID=A0ABD1T7G1_9LAMI